MRVPQLTLLLVLTSFGASSSDDPELQTEIAHHTVPQTVELDGTVQAVNQGTVSAQTNGRVVGLYVDVNDYVEQGTVLLEISAREQSATLDAANAQLASAEAQNHEAQSQLVRYRELFPKGAISQDQMDSIDAKANASSAAVRAAKASVVQAKESLGYTNVRAPYTGIVTERHVELGETVAPGTALVSGFSLNPLRIETEIPQRYIDNVKSAAQFIVQAPNGQTIAPESMNLFSYADAQSHTFKIRLLLPATGEKMFPGMWIKIHFNYGERQALLVPISAVIQRGELSAVVRVKEQQTILNPIRIGSQFGQFFEVLSGLEAGDVINQHAYGVTQKVGQ